MTKGILWVSSRIVDEQKLSDDKFCDWYENIHIPDVHSLPGIPSATRYAASTPSPFPTSWSEVAPWLTVYDMPSLEYKDSAEFKGLDGQSNPAEEGVLEGIFRCARFDTRFYAERDVIGNFSSQGSARYMVSIGLDMKGDGGEDCEKGLKEGLGKNYEKLKGWVRTRWYELVSGTTLERFERRVGAMPKWLVLYEFEGEDAPWPRLKENMATGSAVTIRGDLEEREIGWYVKKREYAD